MALINSSFSAGVLQILAPTIDFKVGDVIEIPDADASKDVIVELARDCIDIAQKDWDSYEISWDFSRHPLA